MNIDDNLEFVRHNVDYLAKIADGHYIDPKVRPKSKRKTWTAEKYKDALLKGIEWYAKQDDATKARYLHSVRDYTMQALQGEFPIERARWVHNILLARPDPKIAAEDKEKKERIRRLRAEQHDMSPLDIKFRCLLCGKFAHERDERNNKRHDKSEVCTCGGVKGPQAEMKERISEYRKELLEKKQIAKEKQKRVAKR